MAYVRGPLFSLEARGSIARALTYQFDGKGYQCRKMPIPTYHRTPKQNTQRNTHKAGILAWQELTEEQKNLWRDYTNNDGNTGYYAFMSQWVHRAATNLFQYKLPPNVGYCLVGENIVGDIITGGIWEDPGGWL